MSAILSHGLSTPPVDERPHDPIRKSSSKSLKSTSRVTKRGSSSLSSVEPVIAAPADARHKRVWKACERCRMKKTKCDGESPCKRCKDDGLVCTAGSRKKTEFKQLPRGYAEVLENTQYALIATVQKLYSMVRNNETWELGEPELNDRGLPVIHNIAEKLGCIRPTPDLPCVFPEDSEEFAELQAQLEAAEREGGDESRRKLSEDSVYSSNSRSQRASSSESERSQLSKDYNKMVWAQQHQQQQHQQMSHGLTIPGQGFQQSSNVGSSQFDGSNFQTGFKQEPQAHVHDPTAFEQRPIASPVYAEFQARPSTDSPSFRNASPFSPWSAGGEDFLAPGHMLDLTAHYMRQGQQRNSFPQSIPRSDPGMNPMTVETSIQRSMRISDAGVVTPTAFISNNTPLTYMSTDGTIRPNMLDCNTGFDLAHQMENVMFGDFETQGGMRIG